MNELRVLQPHSPPCRTLTIHTYLALTEIGHSPIDLYSFTDQVASDYAIERDVRLQPQWPEIDFREASK